MHGIIIAKGRCTVLDYQIGKFVDGNLARSDRNKYSPILDEFEASDEPQLMIECETVEKAVTTRVAILRAIKRDGRHASTRIIGSAVIVYKK